MAVGVPRSHRHTMGSVGSIKKKDTLSFSLSLSLSLARARVEQGYVAESTRAWRAAKRRPFPSDATSSASRVPESA